MRWQRLHDWDVTPEEAERIQLSLAGRSQRSLDSASPIFFIDDANLGGGCRDKAADLRQ